MGTNGMLHGTTAVIGMFGCAIIGGPSREEIFDLLRLNNQLNNSTAMFEVLDVDGNRFTMRATVLGIMNEGAEHQWFLKIKFYEVPGQLMIRHNLPYYDAIYNTRTRKGAVRTGTTLRDQLHVSDDGVVVHHGEEIGRVTF